MARIDVSAIVGFDEMSAEEKLKALTEYEFEIPTPKDSGEEVTKLKTALSRANSQAADYKRQLFEKQTESERIEAERKEREQAVEEELRTLRREKTVSGYLAQYLALGYEKDLASRAAEATADNDAASIMNCQQEFLEAKRKELEAAALNRQPNLTTGSPPTAKAVDHEAENKLRSYMGLPKIK